MAYYQNIFTQVQLSHNARHGRACREAGTHGRAEPSFHWIGRIGNAQIGPIYLGYLGVLSLVSGLIAFEIIGLNMWASVNWSPIEFVRQLPWLALEPPRPEYGIRILPPLAEGGWWLLAGMFMTTSVLLWRARMYRRARALGLGTAYRLGVRIRDMA